MVRVRMDGYILPIVNELTGAISQDVFVPMDKDYKDNALWDVEDDGSLDEIVLEIQTHGPKLSDVARRRHEMLWQNEFSKMYVRELTEARSRQFRGTSYFADAAGAVSFMVGAGALAAEHLPSWVAIGEVMMVFQLAIITGAFTIQGAKAYHDSRTKKYAGTIADHFSTNLRFVPGDEELCVKVLELHDHFAKLDGTSKQINLGMASKAEELGLPVVKKFYEQRMDIKKIEGVVYKLFEKGFFKSIFDGFKKWYKDDDMNIVEQIGEQVGDVPPQSVMDVSIPVSLLPSFDGYDVFVGHRDHEDLRDLASRVGEDHDIDITFEVYVPEDVSVEHRANLEANLSDAIHDNVYRMARIFNVIPKTAIEVGSKVSRYIGIGGGLFAFMGGISTIIAGSPVAGVAFGVGGLYLIARQFVFSKPLTRANKLPFERLIKGQDALQEKLAETDSFIYHVDPSLSALDAIMAQHDTPYGAYVACVNEAKRVNCPDFAAHYIQKSLSVQPLDRESRLGVMSLHRVLQ